METKNSQQQINKSFVINETIKRFEEELIKEPYKLEKPQENIENENKTPEDFFNKLNEKFINKSLLKLCSMWNSNENSRKFVLHLISAFLPVNNWNKIFTFNEETIKKYGINDCLIGIKLAGIKEITEKISEFTTKRMFINAKAVVEHRDKYTDEELKELKDLINSMPIEIKNASIAFYSVNSNKILSKESIHALHYFTQYCIFNNVREIVFTLNKKRFKQGQNNYKNKLNNKQVNKVMKANTFGLSNVIDENTFDKLKSLKNEIENND